MGIHRGPNIVKDSLVFGYDTGYGVADNDTATRFYPGEPTENLIYDMSGTVTSSYPEVVYRCTANETNVVDTSAPGGKYSRFTGIDGSDNNQLYSRFSSYSIDVRGDSVNYSVYLKGSGTCHLTIYDNQSGYGTSGTITLTDEWVRYNYTRTVNASATSYWVAVRGVLNTTDVYIAGQQAMRGTHSTPYIENNRSSTQSLIDLKRTTDIDVSNVSFDSTGQPTFDGSNDYINIPSSFRSYFTSAPVAVELVLKKSSADQAAMVVFDVDVTRWNLNYNLYTSGQWAFDFYDGTEHVISAGNYDDEYVHFVLQQLSNSTMEIYANGVLKGTITSSGNLAPNSSGPRIGSRSNGDSRYFKGELPVFKIYSNSLSTTQVKQNFNVYKNRFNI
jgi:hypothetical protein